MYRARHVGVEQANQLEVACHRKDDGKLLTFEQQCSRDAAGAVEGRGTRGESRTAHGKGWPYLIAGQEGNSVRLVGFHRPCDGIACVNPNLIWQESQALPSQIVTLGSGRGVPLSQYQVWNQHESREKH